jgi:competence protein ComEA
MDSLKRRWLIVLGLAALIVGGSFWGSCQKAAAPARTSAVLPVAQPVPPADGGALVQVSGAVNKPGQYRAGPDSKVIDVINAAGGLAAGADGSRVDLSQPVRDGMSIEVPLRAPAGGGTATAGKVNINTADREELDRLPGIGPVLAQRIIDYRKAHGPFRDIADLKKVSGIGEAKFNQVKDKVTH